MALTYQQAVEQTITGAEQFHEIINGSATSEVVVEDGSKIPSVRKALLDNFYFKDPIPWQQGQSETVFNQIRQFTDGSWWYAPNATTANPVIMGTSPVGDPLWRTYSLDAVSKLTPQILEALRRSYAEAGYDMLVGFQVGNTVTNPAQVLLDELTGIAYSWGGVIPPEGKVVPPDSSPANSGGVGYGAWVDKSNSYQSVTVEQFGAVGDGITIDTLAIQMAIDYVYTVLGGGAVLLNQRSYKVSQSSLNEIYDNDGVPVNASECCIVLRKGVSLIGVAGKTKIWADNPALHLIALVANDGNILRGFEAYNTWVAGGPGAGHGILQFGTQNGADRSCKNTVFEDLYVHNVASYGIGISNGAPENVHFNRIRVRDNGADGLDLKSRGDQTIIPAGNSATNIRIINHGGRVTGSAGIDVRGVWHLSSICVTDFGGNASLDYAGIRFRTKPPISDPYQIVAERSTLMGFTVSATPGAAMLSSTGVVSGSDDVHISNGTVRAVGEGVVIAGNANGNASRCSVSGVTTTHCAIYGFRTALTSDISQFSDCTDDGSPVGFRAEGTNTTLSNCSGSLSVSVAAAPTFLQSSSMLGGAGISLERVNNSTVAVLAKGTAADIALRLVPKGSLNINVHSSVLPDVANTRYLGSGSLPMAGGFTQTAFTVTSDENHKTPAQAIMGRLLDAWEEVQFVTYQFLDRVEVKGSDGARWHFGVVAQRVVEALERHGLDWTQFAFICFDKWDSSPEITITTPAVFDENRNQLEPERVEVIQEAVEAGEKFGIRYEEALVLEAALQRRNYNNLLHRIEKLESK